MSDNETTMTVLLDEDGLAIVRRWFSMPETFNGDVGAREVLGTMIKQAEEALAAGDPMEIQLTFDTALLKDLLDVDLN